MIVEQAFAEWLKEESTPMERDFSQQFDSNSTRAMAFYAGFQAGQNNADERLKGVIKAVIAEVEPYMRKKHIARLRELLVVGWGDVKAKKARRNLGPDSPFGDERENMQNTLVSYLKNNGYTNVRQAGTYLSGTDQYGKEIHVQNYSHSYMKHLMVFYKIAYLSDDAETMATCIKRIAESSYADSTKMAALNNLRHWK